MATSNWRMNGLWRRMVGVLVLCTLLLSSEVICQDDSTIVPVTPTGEATPGPHTTISAATAGSTAALDVGPAGGAGATSGPGDSLLYTTILNIVVRDEDAETATPVPGADEAEAIVLSDNSNLAKNVGNDADDDATSSSSSGSSVFVGILVSGLLAALAITIGYFKCQRRPEKKAVKLAEEAYPVDQETQGNTLVSVAPLNPPPETPEKPSANGESTEAAKTQTPPPTNGHSTPKAADTEL